MRFFTSIAICLFTFLTCNKNEEDLFSGNDTVFLLDDMGRGITGRLMAARHTYDSLHNPVVDTATVLYLMEDSITPGEFSSRKPLRRGVLQYAPTPAVSGMKDADPSYYYDYYQSENNHSEKLLKLVTTVSTDTAFSYHRYAFNEDNTVTADTTIAWSTFVAGIDTSVTLYY